MRSQPRRSAASSRQMRAICAQSLAARGASLAVDITADGFAAVLRFDSTAKLAKVVRNKISSPVYSNSVSYSNSGAIQR